MAVCIIAYGLSSMSRFFPNVFLGIVLSFLIEQFDCSPIVVGLQVFCLVSH